MGLLRLENTISGEDYSIQPDGYKTDDWGLVTGDWRLLYSL